MFFDKPKTHADSAPFRQKRYVAQTKAHTEVQCHHMQNLMAIWHTRHMSLFVRPHYCLSHDFLALRKISPASYQVPGSGKQHLFFVPDLPGWSFPGTYPRGTLAPSAFSRKRELRLPPLISCENTAPSRQSLRKDFTPFDGNNRSTVKARKKRMDPFD
jgi:hypothetical protein